MFNSRPKWLNNTVYILAAIGCAAGLGNLWRFPMLAYEFGGAAFMIALLISNIIIVYPILMAETIIGQRYQTSGPQAMEKIKRGSSWIQWVPVFALFFIVTYYVPVMAWAVKYLFSSFTGAFIENPSAYFITDILGLSEGVNIMGSFQWTLFLCLLLSYGLVLFAMRKNVQSISQVVKITATVPFLFLIILLIRGVTLPGAIDGLYMFVIPDWNALLDIKLWQEAVSQSFFSASVGLGYFYIAGSHRKEKEEVPFSSIWILVGNFLTSILAGVAVFSTLGFMANQQGVPVSDAVQGGPMLVFSVFPTAIAMMPTMISVFAVILFLTVITLAIDSIIGVMEVVAGAFHDLYKKYSYLKILTITIVITLLFGIPYMFGAGLYYLDIIDHFISGYFMLFSGLLECIMVAYIIGPERIRNWINETSKSLSIGKWFNYIMYLLPLVLTTLLIVTLFKETQEVYGGYPWSYIIGFGFVPMSLVLILTGIFGYITTKRNDK